MKIPSEIILPLPSAILTSLVGQTVSLASRIVVSNHFFFFRERDVPSYGVYIVAYEWILEYLYPDQKRPLPTPFETVWVGGVAG